MLHLRCKVEEVKQLSQPIYLRMIRQGPGSLLEAAVDETSHRRDELRSVLAWQLERCLEIRRFRCLFPETRSLPMR